MEGGTEMSACTAGVGDEVAAKIRRYYNDTWFDYRFIWLNPKNRAVHLGYWGPSTQSHSDSLLEVNRLMADHAGVRPGDRVLDAGCGVGGSAMWLAENRGASVVGITLVHDQVERATRYASERGVANQVCVKLRDYTATGFPDASFDVVWGQESICHAPNKRAFIAEAFRVLRPGGRLVIFDFVDTELPKGPNEMKWLDQWTRGWAIAPPPTRSQWLETAREIGFTDVSSTDLTDGVRRSSRRLYRFCVTLYPISILLHVVRIRSEAAQDNIRGSRDQWRLLRHGHWRYELMSFRKPRDKQPST